MVEIDLEATCSTKNFAVKGICSRAGGNGLYGHSSGNEGSGVYGFSNNYFGVYGRGNARDGCGVFGDTGGSTTGIAVSGYNPFGLAGYFTGNVFVDGSVGDSLHSLKIDHPLDPTNKYLYHPSMQSVDMKNLYDGVTSLNDKGEALIELPDWFGALNKDFRYQLTTIGTPGPNLYIGEEISSADKSQSRFKIAGGNSGMKVCWQVTGVRKDPWANANRIQVEEEKSSKEGGYYKHPEVYGQPAEKGLSHLRFPKLKEKEEGSIKTLKANM